jgi:carbon-monoxide dehydrogenase iron sulfur subunit
MQTVYFDEDKCLGCFSCTFACAVEHSKTKDPMKAHTEDKKPVARRKLVAVNGVSVTTTCNHCENPVCVEACITGSIIKNEDGSVSFDTDRCAGCWMCIMVCPFGAIDIQQKNMVKCDLCAEREDSRACVEACPTKALHIK